jgi:hypothetical protein
MMPRTIRKQKAKVNRQLGSLEVGRLEIWPFGDLAVWRFGSLEIWQFGDLAIGALAVGRLGR